MLVTFWIYLAKENILLILISPVCFYILNIATRNFISMDCIISIGQRCYKPLGLWLSKVISIVVKTIALQTSGLIVVKKLTEFTLTQVTQCCLDILWYKVLYKPISFSPKIKIAIFILGTCTQFCFFFPARLFFGCLEMKIHALFPAARKTSICVTDVTNEQGLPMNFKKNPTKLVGSLSGVCRGDAIIRLVAIRAI